MMRRPAIVMPCAVLLLSAGICLPAAAQATAPPQSVTISQVIDALVTPAVRAARETKSKLPFSNTVHDSAAGPVLHYVAGQLIDKEAYRTLANVLAVSTGTQVGSTPSAAGSTSVAMKGLVPAILGFAVEHGAITQEVNRTVATFRVSPAGIVKALQGKGLLDIYEDYSREPGFRFASRFSGAVSFDTSRGDTPGTLVADEKQLSAWSVTATLLNQRDPRAKGYSGEWRTLAAKQGPALIAAREALDKALQNWPAFTAWQTALVQRVRQDVDEPYAKDGNELAAAARFKAILESQLPELADLSAPDPSVTMAMSAYIAQLTTTVKARNDLYAYANEGAIVTFDWTTTRDKDLSDLYTLTGVYADAFTPSRKDDFTANVAVRFYRKAPSGTDRQLKDFSLSAQWDRPLGRVFEIPFILTGAAKYQFIPDDITATGAGAIAPSGHLVLGQAKLTIPLKSGARIPLSVTFANRTELIKEKIIRANFGVTFDLDAFVAAAKAR